MSNMSANTLHECTEHACQGALIRLIETKETDLGDLQVRRALPTRTCRMIGPWVFFDEMGPALFQPGSSLNVRPHPHIGLATVTYLFTGEMLHRDSLGSVQTIEPGAINLMVAGRGIVHSERERPERHGLQRPLHGLQLWLALPTAQEEIAPAFYHYTAGEIPSVMVNEVPVRVLMGSAYGATSPVKLFSPTLYLEASLAPGQSLELPPAAERGLYVVTGELQTQQQTIPAQALALFAPGSVSVTATVPTKLALIGGDNLGERHIEWNFVSSSKARIEAAKQAWRNGEFAKVPGDEQEFIPLP